MHGEHDIVLHRPLVPGESLETWSEPWAVRTTRAGTRVVLHLEQFDEPGELVVEQWWTIFFAGSDVLADAGPEPPDHTFPDAARAHPVVSATRHVDADQPTRYAEVSGDWSPHHFELDAARASGFDYLFAHGLCTMAMCTQAVIAEVAGGDQARVRRVAVRFASPDATRRGRHRRRVRGRSPDVRVRGDVRRRDGDQARPPRAVPLSGSVGATRSKRS